MGFEEKEKTRKMLLRQLTPEELRNWRLKHGLTQQQLAELLGVRHSTISRWETGKHPLPKYMGLLLQCIEEKILADSSN